MTLPAVKYEFRDGFRVRRQTSAEAAAALAALLPDPDVALLRGVTCKPGSRTYGALVDLAGRRYFLKRYNCRGILYRFQNAVRRSRAVYTWQLAWSFLARAVPVPEPLLCLEERRLRLLGRSYVLMEAAAGERLADLWPALPAARRAAVLAHTGRLLGLMHRQGCLHGDLKWGNILLDNRDEAVTIRLVDLDGGRQLWFPVRFLAEKDLERFLEDLRQVGGDAEHERLVTENWLVAWRSGR